MTREGTGLSKGRPGLKPSSANCRRPPTAGSGQASSLALDGGQAQGHPSPGGSRSVTQAGLANPRGPL